MRWDNGTKSAAKSANENPRIVLMTDQSTRQPKLIIKTNFSFNDNGTLIIFKNKRDILYNSHHRYYMDPAPLHFSFQKDGPVHGCDLSKSHPRSTIYHVMYQ